MIQFGQRTTLPTDLNVEEALKCASAYANYHRFFVRSLTEKLEDPEFEQVKVKAKQLEVCFRKIGITLNAEYGAYLHKKQYEADYESYIPKIILPIAFGLIAVFSYFSFVPDSVAAGASVGAFGLWAYDQKFKIDNLNAAVLRLDDRQRELKLLELELENVSHTYKAGSRSVEIFAKIQLLTGGYFDETVYPGHIDQARQPKNLRPSPPLSDEDITYVYGANFEDVDDPRIPEDVSYVLWVKLLIASLPTNIAYKLNKSFGDDYGYSPMSYWDYDEFQRDWKSGSITKLED
jgi:hypothetical protein